MFILLEILYNLMINCYFFVSDEEEKDLMSCIFEFSQELISLNLTENELALLCAVVLIEPGECKFLHYSF